MAVDYEQEGPLDLQAAVRELNARLAAVEKASAPGKPGWKPEPPAKK
jgi:hypothetical protein